MTWVPTNIASGEARDLTVGPPGVAYAAMNNSGIFMSQDNGTTWSPISSPPSTYFYNIWYESVGDYLYVGTEQPGVYRSHRSELDWALIGPPDYFRKIVNSNSGLLYACCVYNGVQISDDHGLTWERLTPAESYGSIALAPNGDAFAGRGSNGVMRAPACADYDEDWWCDGIDNCQYAFNPSQGDSDFDGIGDACDQPIDTIPHTVIAAGTADFYFAISTDLDRDNRSDLLYSDPGSNQLVSAFGQADGSLSPPLNLMSIGACAIVTDFVDTDTLKDVVAATPTDIYVLLNRGARIFGPPLHLDVFLDAAPNFGQSTADSDGPVPSVISGYFDDDGVLDLVAAPSSIYRGLGDGAFLGPDELPFTFQTANSCDFNNDGRDDLVALVSDQICVYLNESPTLQDFNLVASVPVGLPSLEIAPSHQVADLDFDGDCDFAIVVPVENPPGTSRVTILYWDKMSGLDRYLAFPISGVSYDLVVCDPNRDGCLDLVVANGSLGRLEFYFGDGVGNFSQVPVSIDLDPGADVVHVLATLDLNRDGNPDFVSGSNGGGTTRIAYSDTDPAPVIEDESYFPMVTSVSSDVSLTVVNPDGFVISRDFRTVSGSDYWRVDLNSDGLTEEQAVDYNVIPGEYLVTAKLHPDAAANTTITMGIGIDGSQMATLCLDYDPANLLKNGSDSLVFYYEVYPPGQESDVSPPNGGDVRSSSPTFAWDGLVAGPGDRFSFDLCDVPTMMRQKTDSALGLTTPQYAITQGLQVDNVYYWQVGFDRNSDGIYEDYSRVYAVKIVECCVGFVGNVNISGDGSAIDEVPTIQDISLLIDHLFLSQCPLPCIAEADLNFSDDITIGDISSLIGHLFITQEPLGVCPR